MWRGGVAVSVLEAVDSRYGHASGLGSPGPPGEGAHPPAGGGLRLKGPLLEALLNRELSHPHIVDVYHCVAEARCACAARAVRCGAALVACCAARAALH